MLVTPHPQCCASPRGMGQEMEPPHPLEPSRFFWQWSRVIKENASFGAEMGHPSPSPPPCCVLVLIPALVWEVALWMGSTQVYAPFFSWETFIF